MDPTANDDSRRRWQARADLLAEGREWLEQATRSTRYRYLYPEGPHLGLLLLAYQDFDRLDVVGRAPARPWRRRRAFLRLVRQQFRRDAVDRSRRLAFHYPLPRLRRVDEAPPIVWKALSDVDADARPVVEAHLGLPPAGQGAIGLDEDASTRAPEGRVQRGLEQFRSAFVNAALAEPSAIATLHPQFVGVLATRLPASRQYPIAALLLVKLPLQLLLLFVCLFNVAYVAAYFFFNDEVLGRFVSNAVSRILDGELEMRSIHWRGRLLFDLLTGTPHRLVVEDATVWEPFKSFGGERERQAAHAERLEVSLVLHEIIPWNRLGVPEVLDIPWVLHFTRVRTDAPVTLTVREYDVTRSDGVIERVLGLRNAFMPYNMPDGQRKILSIAVDDAELAATSIDVDFTQTGDWRATLELDHGSFDLLFEGPDADVGAIELPFSFEVTGDGQHGSLSIKGIEIPLGDIAIESLRSRRGDVEAGDIAFALSASAAGSPVTMTGTLVHAFPRFRDTEPRRPTLIDATGITEDAGGVVAQVIGEFDLPPSFITAEHAAVDARISGVLTDPIYELAADGLVLDFMDEPAWVAEDVSLAATLMHEELPEPWTERFEPGARRRVLTFERLRGTVLAGDVVMNEAAQPGHLVMPDMDEPWLVHMPLLLANVDPERLLPSSPTAHPGLNGPDLGRRLAGSASGTVSVERLVIGKAAEDGGSALREMTLEFADVKLRRAHGPEQDGIPRAFALDRGTLRLDEHGAVELADVLVRTDGTSLAVAGGIVTDPEGSTRLRDLRLDLQAHDGHALSRALALPPYFSRLTAGITLFGPLGAPNGRQGSVEIAGLLDHPAVTTATVRMRGGVLEIESDRVHLLGGHGPVKIAVSLFERGAVSSDPAIRASVKLQGVELDPLPGDVLGGRADVEIDVDDGSGGAAPWSRVRLSGAATSDALMLGGSTYRDALLSFQLVKGELAIEQLVLPIHRPVSPRLAGRVTVPVGRIIAEGTVTLESDPVLDLVVGAQAVPFGVVTGMLGIESPLRGRIGAGTELVVTGRISRPSVEGKVALEGLSVRSIPLGSGQLEVTSNDFAAEGQLAGHREVRVRGDLASRRRRRPDDEVQWTVDAVMAVGAGDSVTPNIAAQLKVRFDQLSIPALLRDPTDPDAALGVDGRLEGAAAQVLTCNPGAPMLSDCVAPDGTVHAERTFAIELELDRLWLRSDRDVTLVGDPCAQATTLCSRSRLVATMNGLLVELADPWRLGTTGDVDVTVAGTFDLSSPPAPSSEPPPASCQAPGVPNSSGAPPQDGDGQGHAELAGKLDLATLAPLLQPLGLRGASGRLDLDVTLDGRVLEPRLGGHASVHASPGQALVIELEKPAVLAGVPDETLALRFSELELAIDRGWLSAAGHMGVFGSEIGFGSSGDLHTGYAFAGPCAGAFGVSVDGMVSGRTLAAALGNIVVAERGGIDIERLRLEGRVRPELALSRLDGRLGFETHALGLEFTNGLSQVELDRGGFEFTRCDRGACGSIPDGWFRVHMGGGPGKDSGIPEAAVRMRAGLRGLAHAWGVAYLSPAFDRAEGADLHVHLDDVPYRSFDARGRLVYEGELSSNDVSLTGGDPLVVGGEVDIDNARYVKDAVEGVEMLALTEGIEQVSAPLPNIFQGTQLDLHFETDRPLRVENNIATGVEAQMVIDVTGTYDDPELAGRVEVEPGGTVDVPFLTGNYEIQTGRVTLIRRIEDAEVDVRAQRREPVYIDDQPRQIQLILSGTLREVRWSCIADGDASGELESVRACTEYLVLGTGDVQISEADVQRFGGGGLANARKPLQVVGHLTELDFGERLQRAIPRIGLYVPETRFRLGQIGPELEVATQRSWFDWTWGRAQLGLDYTRGYPGFLLRQSVDLSVRIALLEWIMLEFRRQDRQYLNNRIIFDPLEQSMFEMRLNFEVPSPR